jgi:hypothetical protein
MERLLAAVCFTCAAAVCAAAQTAEEAVAYILFGKEEAQIPGVMTKRVSSSPAIFETKSSVFASRLTVSTTDQCRFKAIEVSKTTSDPQPSTVTLEFDFSSAAPPVKTATTTASGAPQVLVQVAGLKLIGCGFQMAGPEGAPKGEFEREMEKIACESFKKGMPVTQYSSERATKALTVLRTNYCKTKAS